MEFTAGMTGWFNIQKYINVIQHIKRMKEGKHTTYYLNCLGKTFDKIQHPLMIKPLSKLGVEKIFLNIVWLYMKKSTGNIILKGERLEIFL